MCTWGLSLQNGDFEHFNSGGYNNESILSFIVCFTFVLKMGNTYVLYCYVHFFFNSIVVNICLIYFYLLNCKHEL
jgi:hypothetical protein